MKSVNRVDLRGEYEKKHIRLFQIHKEIVKLLTEYGNTEISSIIFRKGKMLITTASGRDIEILF